MLVLRSILLLLLDVRAHIPGQPVFGSPPTDVSHRTLRAVIAFLVTAFVVLALVWLAVGLVLRFL